MRLIADIDILGNEPFQARVAQLSLAVIAATVLAAVVLGLAVDGEKLDVWWWVALAAGSFVALPVHELVHAAAFKLLCHGCTVSFGCRMVCVLLAPSVLVTAVLAALALAAGLPVLSVLLAGIHLSGCAGDILMAVACLREGACTHVRDTQTGITLLSEHEGTA